MVERATTASASTLMAAAARTHRRELCVIATLAVAEASLVLAQPWPLKLAIDNAIGGHRFPRWLRLLEPLGTRGRTAFAIACSLALVGAATVLSYALHVRATRTSETIGVELRRTLMDRLLTLDVGFHEHHHSGELASRLTSDVARVEDVVVSISSVVVPELLTLIGIVVIMLGLDPPLAVAAALVVPLLWAVTVRRRRAVRVAERLSRDEAGRLSARGTELVRNAAIVQAFGQQPLVLRRYAHQNRRALDSAVAAVTVEARYRPIADLLVACVGGLCLALGVARVVDGSMTVGTLLVLLAYMSRVFGPVRALSSLVTSLGKASASCDRLLDVLNAPDALASSPDAPSAPCEPGDVVLTDVTFGYNAEEPVLRGVTLTLPAGAFVAIVGRSGAGKSTLLQLLRRTFDPTSGTIALAGRPLDEYAIDTLRNRTAYVPQDSTLIEGTIADNIAFGRNGAAFHEVCDAARRARADEFIRALPRGYDTVLGEGGTRLSGGERRRIALARAVVRDAPLVLLDEPTAGLDPASESAVLEALVDLAADRTVVVVSHHSSIAARADVVVVLDDGVVAEVGSPAALVAADGPFSRFWASARSRTNHLQVQRGEWNHEQGQWLLGSGLRGRRLGQVEEVEQVQQVQQVAQVRQVGLPLGDERGGGRGATASPRPSKVRAS